MALFLRGTILGDDRNKDRGSSSTAPKSSTAPLVQGEIRVSPVALFQMIKDIRMSPSIPKAHGHLHGMPANLENHQT
jgi:hypothetical protein